MSQKKFGSKKQPEPAESDTNLAETTPSSLGTTTERESFSDNVNEKEEEIGRAIENTTLALANLLHTVERTAKEVVRLAEEQQSTVPFFASMHKYLKEHEQADTEVTNTPEQDGAGV